MSATFEPAPGQTPEGWLTDSWYFIAASRDVRPGTQKRITLLSQPVMVGRTEAGNVFALRDICPHRLVPLSAGRQIDTQGEPSVECPYHGWRFGIDGVCRLLPSLIDGDPTDPAKIRVRHYPAHEAHGMIFVYVADNPRSTHPPIIPPPDFGPLPDKPRSVVSTVSHAPMDMAMIGLMNKLADPHAQGPEPRLHGWAMVKHPPAGISYAVKMLFGNMVTAETLFKLPGYSLDILRNKKTSRLMLTCLTPQETEKTLITQMTFWTNAPPFSRILSTPPDLSFSHDETVYDQENVYLTFKSAWIKARTTNTDFENPVRQGSGPPGDDVHSRRPTGFD